MRILSINSGASGRIAAFIDKDGKAQTRRFAVNVSDEEIKSQIDSGRVFDDTSKSKKPGKDKKK